MHEAGSCDQDDGRMEKNRGARVTGRFAALQDLELLACSKAPVSHTCHAAKRLCLTLATQQSACVSHSTMLLNNSANSAVLLNMLSIFERE